jgi:hypothetical protein
MPTLEEPTCRAYDARAQRVHHARMGYVRKDTISDDLIHVIREMHTGHRGSA